MGDLAVVSFFDPETQEIAAFEELIGAHGGLGGAQTRPFLLYPADWELDLAPLIGAPMVYQQLRDGWSASWGSRSGSREAPSTAGVSTAAGAPAAAGTPAAAGAPTAMGAPSSPQAAASTSTDAVGAAADET